MSENNNTTTTTTTTTAISNTTEEVPKESGLNVSYVLLAEFDIDKGSGIAFQYPQPTGEDTQYLILKVLFYFRLLAEMMLPDGAHKRDEDWTVFFLGRNLSEFNITPSV